MENKKLHSENGHMTPIVFTEFTPQEVLIKGKPADEKPLDSEMEKRITEIFSRRRVLEGLGAYEYEFDRITGGIFKKEEDQYSLRFSIRDLIKENAEMPVMKLISENASKRKTFRKTTEANLNFMARFFPLFCNIGKNKCAELIIRDEAYCIAEKGIIEHEKLEKIKNKIAATSPNLDNYFYVDNVIATSIDQNILSEAEIKGSVDGVYAKIEGKYYSGTQESSRELRISAILIPLNELDIL